MTGRHTAAPATRRTFLRAFGAAGGALALGGAGWWAPADSSPPRRVGLGAPSAKRVVLPVGPYGVLAPPDANGLRLPVGFVSRVVARSGQTVPGSGYVWHDAPDGGACFADGDGWIYVSNSEIDDNAGGVGALRFSADGTLLGAHRILDGTNRNCAGGATPWGTWLSCEETARGLVYETFPRGDRPAIRRDAMGAFRHEAAAVDPVRQCVYLTEDQKNGCFYRFLPDAYPDLGAGRLEVLCGELDGPVRWEPVPDPTAKRGLTRKQVGAALHFDCDKPIAKFTKRELTDLLYKEPTKLKVEGINLTSAGLIPTIQKSFLAKDVEAMQPHIRAFVDHAVVFATCPDCDGTRLAEHARTCRIAGKSIADVCRMQISDLAEWARGLNEPSVAPLLGSLQHALDKFVEIGLGYLSLDRPSGTLSGGEAQRTKMIRHLGSSLTDVTYVFDEPTIGLHPHDIARMNDLLRQVRDKGNTVLVVEHKPETIAIADHVVDLGPGAGTAGGEVVFTGTVAALRKSGTLTGRHLDDRAALKPSVRERTGVLEIRGATLHNLQKANVDLPLG